MTWGEKIFLLHPLMISNGIALNPKMNKGMAITGNVIFVKGCGTIYIDKVPFSIIDYKYTAESSHP